MKTNRPSNLRVSYLETAPVTVPIEKRPARRLRRGAKRLRTRHGLGAGAAKRSGGSPAGFDLFTQRQGLRGTGGWDYLRRGQGRPFASRGECG